MSPPLWHHMSYSKIILTIWQIMKSNGQIFSELGKIWKYNLCFSKISIFHLFQELEKTWKYTQPKANIWKSKFRIYGKIRNKLCPNLSLNVENKMENSHKKGWSHFKLNINDSDILFPKILRIYQWIGKIIFRWWKWNEPIGNSTHTAEYLTKRPWRYLLLAYVYIVFVHEIKRVSVNMISCVQNYFSFSHDFVDNSHFGWEIHGLLEKNTK